QRIIYDEEKKLTEHQAQTKFQMAKYEDELARKRMQAENEYHRVRNQQLVKLQEESSIRLEQARRAAEEKIQVQRRQTEKEKADIERETIRITEMAGAEVRVLEAKLSEEVNRRLLLERGDTEREKCISIINTTSEHIRGAFF
ncbi:ATPase family AAA domain-containing protein 3-like, partial [Trifolium medium]|nr:ATPase family AAA domain-containing protein 3-like [Trifolium medium]